MSRFLGVPIRRGEVVREQVPVAEFADGSPVALPVITVGGSSDGPTVYIQAGLHGDEASGIEACRQALARLDPGALAGNVVAIPVANVPSYLTRTRGFLHEERWLVDINRVFPGDRHGLLTHRLAATLFDDFVCQADVTIDLHSALDGCNILPFAYLDPADDETGTLALRERVALGMGLDYLYCRPRGTRLGTSDFSSTISTQADQRGAPLVTLELGESRRVTTDLLPRGVAGILGALAALEMLPPREAAAPPRRFSEVRPVHTDRGGGLRMSVELGQEVEDGQAIGQVVDLYGDTVETLVAPYAGLALRVMSLSSVSTGAEVAWIVR